MEAISGRNNYPERPSPRFSSSPNFAVFRKPNPMIFSDFPRPLFRPYHSRFRFPTRIPPSFPPWSRLPNRYDPRPMLADTAPESGQDCYQYPMAEAVNYMPQGPPRLQIQSFRRDPSFKYNFSRQKRRRKSKSNLTIVNQAFQEYQGFHGCEPLFGMEIAELPPQPGPEIVELPPPPPPPDETSSDAVSDICENRGDSSPIQTVAATTIAETDQLLKVLNCLADKIATNMSMDGQMLTETTAMPPETTQNAMTNLESVVDVAMKNSFTMRTELKQLQHDLNSKEQYKPPDKISKVFSHSGTDWA